VMNMLMVSPGRSPNAVTGTLRAGARPGIGRTPDLLLAASRLGGGPDE
jgi:hypothetical protein